MKSSSSACATTRARRTQPSRDAAACAIYKATDGIGAKWAKTVVEAGGVAVEDLAAVDFDGDGKIDIVAAGRQTHNLRIYWNQGAKK